MSNGKIYLKDLFQVLFFFYNLRLAELYFWVQEQEPHKTAKFALKLCGFSTRITGVGAIQNSYATFLF
jgi:hypothetical protein